MKHSILKFAKPTIEGKIINRYKRFLADVKLANGEIITVHVPNSGSMKTCWEPNARVILSDFGHIKTRKLRYTLQAVEMADGWVGVNTQNPNKAIEKSIREGVFEDFREYKFVQPEVKINKESRLDLALWKENAHIESFKISEKRRRVILNSKNTNSLFEPICFIEIKNVTLKCENNGVSFPDATTTRGQKHLRELIKLKKAGNRAIILFFVERNSAEWVTTSDNVDPEYGKLLRIAMKDGVEAIAVKAQVSEYGIEIYKKLPVKICTT